MRMCGAVVLMLLASGCTATRVVHLNTGQGEPITYRPVDTAPIQMNELEFEAAVAQLVLDMRLNVGLGAPARKGPLTLLASAGTVDIPGGAQDLAVPPSYARICQQQGEPDECLSLLSGGFTLGSAERRMMALFFAFDTVWAGVEDAVRDLTNPAALRAMVVSMAGTALIMMVAPEPITKLIAIALTASLIAYLGAVPVWNLGQGFLRLMEEADSARSFSELEDTGHRFGRVLGHNGARVLIIAVLTALGGRSAMAAQGPNMPGFAQAALRAQTEGGFRLSGALAGEVHAIALPSAEVLNVTLAPTAVAAVAMGAGGTIQGDPEGDIHHICTDKNEVSAASGGPWTPLFQQVFDRAKMSLNDAANKVRIKGHKGPHPAEYHREVLRRIDQATLQCRSPDPCRAALMEELANMARDLLTEGSRLRKLFTKGA